MSAIGRNDPCSCGSGKKYKKCCAREEFSSSNIAGVTVSQVEQYRTAAMQLQHAGQFLSAIGIYQKIIQLAPLDVEALFELGRLQGLLNIVHSKGLLEAIASFQIVVDLRPDDLQAHIELAKVLTKNFDMQRVLDCTATALQKFPSSIPLMGYRGTAFIHLGSDSEARDVLERANALEPYQIDIVTTLAGLYKNLGLFDEARKILRLQLDHGVNQAVDMANIHYALAFVEDKDGDYFQAWQAFTEAGRQQLKSPECQSWSVGNSTDIIDQFSKNISEKKSLPSLSDLSEVDRGVMDGGGGCQLVFFVGFPRSGTTLTEQVLAAHSSVNTSEERIDLGMAIDMIYQRYQRNYDDDALAVFNRCTAEDFALLRSTYWRSIDANKKVKGHVYIDKLPLNINHIAWIQAAFPDAKLLVALRDPRDVCLSCFFQNFLPNVAMNHFLDWGTTTTYYRHVMSLWLTARDVLDVPWMETRYEDTIADLEGQAQRLIEFLGLDWEPEIMSYRETLVERVVATPSNTAIRQPLNRSAIARWTHYPQAVERAQVDLESIVQALGYKW